MAWNHNVTGKNHRRITKATNAIATQIIKGIIIVFCLSFLLSMLPCPLEGFVRHDGPYIDLIVLYMNDFHFLSGIYHAFQSCHFIRFTIESCGTYRSESCHGLAFVAQSDFASDGALSITVLSSSFFQVFALRA